MDQIRTFPDGSSVVTTGDKHVRYAAGSDRPIESWSGDGPRTSFEYRDDGRFVATSGDEHTLFDPPGADGQSRPLKFWDDSDPKATQTYTYNSNGTYAVGAADGSTTTFATGGNRLTTIFPDGTAINWDVELHALQQAITRVQQLSGDLSVSLEKIRSTFQSVEDCWDSPSGRSFHPLQKNFASVAADVNGFLDEAVRRMRTAHQNYRGSDETGAALLRSAMPVQG